MLELIVSRFDYDVQLDAYEESSSDEISTNDSHYEPTLQSSESNDTDTSDDDIPDLLTTKKRIVPKKTAKETISNACPVFDIDDSDFEDLNATVCSIINMIDGEKGKFFSQSQ